MKRITLSRVLKLKPCQPAIDWCNSLVVKSLTIDEVFSKLREIDRFDWSNWLITRLMTRKQNLQYAIYAAEQVIDIYEKRYPDSDKPRLAIKAAKKVLRKDTRENRDAAYAAANAAAYAAYAADAADAAYAAYAAAYAADAAYAAYAAAYAADAAANAAAYAAVRKEMQIKILNYGIKLLKGDK